MKRILNLLVFGLATAGLVACGGNERAAGDAPANFQGIQYPDWVMKGSGAFGGDTGRVLMI